mgnify:CR=1 FL=1
MRLGAIVIFILSLLSCYHNKNNRLTILFDNVEGLKEGAFVYYKGIIVGEVIKFSLNIPKDQVAVDIELNDSIRIPAESKFILNPSVIGSAHITIEPSSQTAFLSSHDTITGVQTREQLLDDIASDTVKRRKVKEAFDKIGEGVKGLIEAYSKDSSKSSK